MTAEKTLHGFVRGRVQGVWFRRETKREADRLGLSGWVRNLADGRVEFFARGSSAGLDELTAWLQRGPALARVDELSLTPTEEQSPAYAVVETEKFVVRQ